MTKVPDGRNRSEIIFYQAEDAKIRLQVRLEYETVWLTQKMMAELFQKDIRTISEHIRNILDEGELQADSVIRKFRITAEDGKSYETNHYNLDVIISVGYRVKSHRGTQFRIWATQRLREYIIKGFALDDERVKPAKGQFQIFYRHGADHLEYQPDFVAETGEAIFMLEPKASKQTDDPIVLAKKEAALNWCANASTHARSYGGKPWCYMLIPHDEIAANITLGALAARFGG